MEVFEIHITGDESIHNAAEELGQKTIALDLLKPDGRVLRRQHMTSIISKYDGIWQYSRCKEFVDWLVASLRGRGVDIHRIKIESPYYDYYKSQSLYMETHFESDDSSYPLTVSVKKQKSLATDREYRTERYDEFREKYQGKELELCLFDSFVNEDKDWFDLYKE